MSRRSGEWAIPAGRLLLRANVARDVWLAARRSMICASDIAPMLGVSQYRNRDAFAVWSEKTGRTGEQEATAAMTRGQLFETPIIDLWQRHHLDYTVKTRRAGLIQARDNAWAGATVDRLSVCPLGRCVVEVKSTTRMDEWDDDGVPTDFQLQGQWQLRCTGRDHVHFVVLGPRLRLFDRVMDRDEVLIDALDQRVRSWWPAHVEADVPPPPTAKSLDTLRDVFPVDRPGVGGQVDVADRTDLADAAAIYAKTVQVIAGLEAERDAALARLQAGMGEATELVDGDRVIATWRGTATVDGATRDWQAKHSGWVEEYGRRRTVVDTRRLVAEHPEALTTGLRFRRSWSWKGLAEDDDEGVAVADL